MLSYQNQTQLRHKITVNNKVFLSYDQGHLVVHSRWNVDIIKCSRGHGTLVDTKETESKMLRKHLLLGVVIARGKRLRTNSEDVQTETYNKFKQPFFT